MSFKDNKFARIYEQRLAEEGYPGALLGPVLDELEQCDEIIDVGAGTGFFALPLARKGKRVRAVEPSPEMISLFKAKIPAELESLISIDQTGWEDWDGPIAQGLICIHAVYVIPDLEKALLKMKQKSSVSLVVVRASQSRRVLSQEIRKRLGINQITLTFLPA